jgi:tRNA (guanine9-N1)-methyltransferase
MDSNGNSTNSSNDVKNDDLPSAAATTTTTTGTTTTTTNTDTNTNTNNPDGGTITTTETATATTTPTTPPILSKNRKKKLEKIERTKKKKLERKEREKARKRAEAISQGRDLDAERKVMEERTKSGEGRKRSDEMWRTKLVEAKTRFEICIDLGGRQCKDTVDDDNNNDLMLSNFEKVMREREIASLAQQIRYCYSYNKRSPNPVLTAITGLSKKSISTNTSTTNLTTVRTILERESGFGEWNRRLFDCNEQSLEDYYGLVNDKKEDNNNKANNDENKEDEGVQASSLLSLSKSKSNKKIVYLTSDSTTTLDTLNDDTIYVIGGIVDRNRLKYATINRAEKELIVSTAKLPLTEYLTSTIPISTTTKSKNEEIRNVPLTVNHVFDIMLKYKQYNNNWDRAFQDVLPSRKDKDIVKNNLDGDNKNGNNNKIKNNNAGVDSNNNKNDVSDGNDDGEDIMKDIQEKPNKIYANSDDATKSN